MRPDRIVVLCGALTVAGAAVVVAQGEAPEPPIVVQPAPGTPVNPESLKLLWTPTAPPRTRAAERFPMPVVVRDPSLYPMVVAGGNSARYPIRIIGPQSVPVPPGSTLRVIPVPPPGK